MKKTQASFLLAGAFLLSACVLNPSSSPSGFSSEDSSIPSSEDSSSLSSPVPSSSSDVSISDSSSASSSVSSSSVSSSLSSEEDIPVLSAYDFRIAPRFDEHAASLDIYKIGLLGGEYRAQKATSIAQNQDALTPEEVAEYYVSFRAFPPNYFADKQEALAYGENGRLLSTYYSGGYHTYDYTVKLGSFNIPSGGTYYEFDIALSSSYNTGTSISRGAGRVVVVADGIEDYGSDPVCYFTDDHYADFKEYYNFYQGWSPLFEGVANSSGGYTNTPKTTLDRPQVPTVSYSLL